VQALKAGQVDPAWQKSTDTDVSGLYSTWTKDGFTPVIDASSWKCSVNQSDAGQFKLTIRPIQVKSDNGRVLETLNFKGTISYSASVYGNGATHGTDAFSVTKSGKYRAQAAANVDIYVSALPSSSLANEVSKLLGGFDFDCNYPTPQSSNSASRSKCSGFNYFNGVNETLPLFVRGTKAAEDAQRPTYRLYNPNSGEHFYTANAGEKGNLVADGWNYEGIGWYAPSDGGTPVYRLYNPNAGDHFYTMSASERNSLVKTGWNYEGVAFASASSSSGTPVYRAYNPNAKVGSHNYTMNHAEQSSLIKAGWRNENIAWYEFKN
jgi:hypothetical protein